MTDDVESISGYADLVSDPELPGSDPDILARVLQNHGRDDEYMVAWAPDWLVDEKDLETEGRSPHVVTGQIDHETEKAYLVVQGSQEVWLPKTVITRYRAAPDAEISVPQHGLGDYANGGESA